jgi:hypothetical protein
MVSERARIFCRAEQTFSGRRAPTTQVLTRLLLLAHCDFDALVAAHERLVKIFPGIWRPVSPDRAPS